MAHKSHPKSQCSTHFLNQNGLPDLFLRFCNVGLLLKQLITLWISQLTENESVAVNNIIDDNQLVVNQLIISA